MHGVPCLSEAETRDEDQSGETKVIVTSEDVPKRRVISENVNSQGLKPVSSFELSGKTRG